MTSMYKAFDLLAIPKEASLYMVPIPIPKKHNHLVIVISSNDTNS
jgi:hypothetical protein